MARDDDDDQVRKPGKKKPADDDTGALDDDDEGGLDDLFGDDDLEETATPAADAAAEGEPQRDDASLIAQLSSVLEAEGMVVPSAGEMNLEEYVRHIITSVATKKHHESKNGAGTDPNNTGGDPNMANNGTGGGTPTAEQNQFTMMSLQRENQELKADLADRRLKEVKNNLSLAVKAGLIDQARMDGDLAKVNTKQLSLVQKDDSEVSRIAYLAKELGAIARNKLKADGLLDERTDLSLGEPAPRPAGQWGEAPPDPEKIKEFREKLTTKGPAAKTK